MHKLKRLRRREVPVDVHSEDEEEFDVTRGVLEFSDISDSEASCEDSDVETEGSHSEGEEETQGETSILKEESTITREELSLIKKDPNPIQGDASSLVEDTVSISNEVLSENVTKSKEGKEPMSTNKQKLKVDGQLEAKQGENDSITAIKDSDANSIDGDEECHSENENDAQDEKNDDSQNSVSAPEISGWQKKVLARQEYRKKLAEDPAFVPHLGEFWGHDDRFTKEEFKDDFDSNFRSFSSRGKVVWGNSPPRGRWGHDGFEELMRIEDEEKHRKEFQHRIQHRRGFVPLTSRRRSHFHNNIAPPKFNHSRPSNLARRRMNSFEEQSRSRGMLLSRHDARNKRENLNSKNFNQHNKSTVHENRSENPYNGNKSNINSALSRLNDNKPFVGKDNSYFSKGGNGFRSHSSRHYMRSSLNRDHSFNSNQIDGEVDRNKSKEQNSNRDDIDNNKDSHVLHNTGQHESHDSKFKDNVNTAADYQIEKTDANNAPSSTKEGKSLVKEESNKESKSEVDKEAIIDDGTHPISRSIDNVTSSFNDLSINNNPSDIIGSLPSTSMDKDRVQTNQASKRYSTRRAVSSSITQTTQINDSLVSEVSNNPRTSEIPPSAVFAPPFQPRALALSDENSISNEGSSNNSFPQKPETPIAYYTDNLPQGLRNNENNLPQPTSIPAPAPYVTESNGMVYYYDPNMYYYYYPAHTTPELKDTNDNSIKPSFVSQPSTTVQENNGVYYYYPVYYQ